VPADLGQPKLGKSASVAVPPYAISTNFNYGVQQQQLAPTPQSSQPALNRNDSQPSPRPMLTARQQLYQKHLEKAKQQEQAGMEEK
jgi:hypothetical protein